jgi:hypothetical protein
LNSNAAKDHPNPFLPDRFMNFLSQKLDLF